MSRYQDDQGHGGPGRPPVPARAARGRLWYASVMSTLAVLIALGGGRGRHAASAGLGARLALQLIALGGGTAYAAATIVARAKLADNALALGGVKAASYRQDVSTTTSTTQVPVAPGSWVTVLAWKFTTHHAGPMLVLDQLTADDTGKTPGTVQVRLVLNGKPDDGVATYPIGPGPLTIAGAINCNWMPAATYSARLQVQATAASLIVNTSNEFALRPLVVPPT